MSVDPEFWGDSDEGPPSSALVVDEVRIVMTDPPRYEVVVDGVVVPCALTDLINRHSFQARCLAVLHRIPDVPNGKGSIQVWQAMVNRWLEGAIKIKAPEEASPRLFERAAVAEAVAGMLVVSADDEGALADFRRGCAVYRDERVFVRLPALRTRLRAEFPKLGPDDLADHLRLLGWVSCRLRLSGAEAVQAWYAGRTVWEKVPSWPAQIAEISPEAPEDH